MTDTTTLSVDVDRWRDAQNARDARRARRARLAGRDAQDAQDSQDSHDDIRMWIANMSRTRHVRTMPNASRVRLVAAMRDATRNAGTRPLSDDDAERDAIADARVAHDDARRDAERDARRDDERCAELDNNDDDANDIGSDAWRVAMQNETYAHERRVFDAQRRDATPTWITRRATPCTDAERDAYLHSTTRRDAIERDAVRQWRSAIERVQWHEAYYADVLARGHEDARWTYIVQRDGVPISAKRALANARHDQVIARAYADGVARRADAFDNVHDMARRVDARRAMRFTA